MIPHIMPSRSPKPAVPSPWSSAPVLLPSFRDPSLDVPLFAGAHRERSGRNVLTNRGAAADVRAAPDGHGRHELRIAADERAVLDRRPGLLFAVVVAGDRAGADVHLRANGRVPEIREVHRLRGGAE